MSKIKSDSEKTSSIYLTFQSAVNECENISKPSKDESTTVSGNKNAHSAIDELLSINKSIASVIETASKKIQNVGTEFEHTDQSISNEISKN
ncbi:TIGR04197 family type VII secretion effector [Staphylococcus edaphicus]|uniref:TIGR04197 family type VII secretion effector n=1 Tax=Staphylococcus edaphicus TaxID=1955013 RepID=A0A2C6WMQ9_9STAP|nr:TIGR04197 family type VII secretion effector [Staphylococcus edaphicus]PHK48727.1 TIGR04197 family type VII secretion effector [Staphylococcus edaphicus]UQW81651.1 TIGR04197 family type VII secretion effector [Staphylococcus edaphicus]